jgi:hypothetical protein
MKGEKNSGTFYSYILKKLLKDFALKPKDEQFNIQGLPGERASAGIAYLFLPQDISREEYINRCLRTNMISLINENERLDNVIISQNIINDLNFPKKTNEIGSGLIWVKAYPTNQIIAIGVVNKKDEIKIDKENQINIFRENDYCKIGIAGDPDNNFLNIEIENKDKNKSEINLKILGDNKESKLNIYSSGNLNIVSKNEFTIQTNKKISFVIFDEEEKEIPPTYMEYINGVGLFYKDSFGNTIDYSDTGLISKIGNFKLFLTKLGEFLIENTEVCNFQLKLKDNTISLTDSLINIESKENSNIRIKTGENEINLSDSGVNIEAGEKSVYINGDKNVLYSKIPDATSIIDVSEIGVSTKVKVGE